VTPIISEFVKHTGILGYNEVTTSDHRTLYADIDLSKFLGGEPSALETRAARGIVSNDPRAVKVYQSQLEACLDDSPLEKEMDVLRDSIKVNGGVMNGSHKREADRLEASFTAMKQTSERQCARIQSYPWSPKLRDVRIRPRYWHMAHTQLKLEVDLSKKMDRIDPEGQFEKEGRVDEANRKKEEEEKRRKKATVDTAAPTDDDENDESDNDRHGQQNTRQQTDAPRQAGTDDTQSSKPQLPITLAMVQFQMRRARKALKKVINNAKILWQDHMEDCARLAAYKGNGDKATAVSNIMRAEAQRHSWAKIRRGMGRSKRSGLLHVLVQNEDARAGTE
jgi:hypothetical protein